MIPVYQRPPEFYCRTENGPNQKKRTVGADINNLIFLTQDEGIINFIIYYVVIWCVQKVNATS